MKKKTVLVTGATGFIGRALVKALSLAGYYVHASVRSDQAAQILTHYSKIQGLDNITVFITGELTEYTQWNHVLSGVDTVVHCAARVHVLNEKHKNPLEIFRQVNCDATENFAKQASSMGVTRFIFISSIKVIGEYTEDHSFTELTIPRPISHYAQAKWEAEKILTTFQNTMETVIVRPPLVYGKGVKGNFEKLINLIDTNIPLPFGSVSNKRKFISIGNLISFILICIEHEKAANQVFVISDKENVSTPELIYTLAQVLNKKTRILPCPPKMLNICLKIFGKSKMSEQLLKNLEIDSTKAKTLLGWEAEYSMKEELNKAFSHQKIGY